MHHPLANLCAALAAPPYELDAEAIADALWLAAAQGEPKARDPGGTVKPPSAPIRERSKPPPEKEKGKETQENSTGSSKRGPVDSPPPPLEKIGLALPPPRPEPELMGPIVGTPAGRALPNARQLARGLKLLNRPIPARTRRELDEAAMIRRYSEDRLWLPALRPARARWLEIALVVDISSSMALWKRTVREVLGLLERQGAFRDVRLWRLDTSAPAPRLLGRSGPAARQPKELIHPAGRRVVLLASDCLGAAWRGPELAAWLEQWGRAQPLAIAQMLPPRLWRATALAAQPVVTLSSSEPGAPNQRLRWRSPRPSLTSTGAGLPVPVFSLDSDLMRAWSRMVLGQSSATVEGYLWKRDFARTTTTRTDPGNPMTIARRLAVFRAVASPEAVRLAELLSVVPLRLPVARLVQQVMLPHSSPAQLAEVFLSGLVRRTTPPDDPRDIDEVEFDFLPRTFPEPSLRDQLQSGLPAAAAQHAREAVSAYICERLGIADTEFDARLIQVNSSSSKPEHTLAAEFARISARVLERLGRGFARELDRWRIRPLSVEQEQRFMAWGTRRSLASTLLTAIAQNSGAQASALWGSHSIAECCQIVADLFHHLEPDASGRLHQDDGPVQTSWGRPPVPQAFPRDPHGRLQGKTVPRQMKPAGMNEQGVILWDFHVSVRAEHAPKRWGFLALRIARPEPYPQPFCDWVEGIAVSLGTRFAQLAGGSGEPGKEIPEGARVTLRVTEIRGRLEFHLRCAEIELEKSFHTAHREKDIALVVAQLREWHFSQFSQRVVEMGSRLAGLVLPEPLALWLGRQRAHIGSLLLMGDPTGIPWEIVRLGGRSGMREFEPFFLAELPLVRWIHDSRTSVTLNVRQSCAHFLITDYRDLSLEGMQREQWLLEKRFDARPINPHRPDLTAKTTIDLLHVAGHGTPEGFVLSRDRTLGPADLRHLVGNAKLSAATLCVFNFDHSAQFVAELAGMGVGAFVGTNSEIDDLPAADFAERLYQALREGRTFAEATGEARRALREKGSAEWLRYVVYGNPDARLQFVRDRNPFRDTKILWVDDRPENNSSLVPILQTGGAEVVTALSTDEGLAALAQTKFDAIISDMGRPEGAQAGMDLLDRVREAGHTMPFVIFAGTQGPQFANQVRSHLGQLGTNDFRQVMDSLAAALRSAQPIAHHLPQEALAELSEFMLSHVDDSVLRALDLSPSDNPQWPQLWKNVRPEGAPGHLCEIARRASLAPAVHLYRSDAKGLIRYWFGTGSHSSAHIPEAATLAFARHQTVRMEAGREKLPSTLRVDTDGGSEVAIPVATGIVLYLRSPLPLAFGPRQIRWLEALARSAAGLIQTVGDEEEMEAALEELEPAAPPKMDFEDDRGTDPDDRNKGRFGGKSAAHGREVIAVTSTTDPSRPLTVDFVVRSTDGTPLQGPVHFYLHDSFEQWHIPIKKIAHGTEAHLTGVRGYEGFTLGVQVKNARGRWIALELDLFEHIRLTGFVFQSTPENWAMSALLRAGKTADWRITRYKKQMQPGQPVLFWSAHAAGRDDARGLWGWGIVTGKNTVRRRGVDYRDVVCIERWAPADVGPRAPIQAGEVFSLLEWRRHTLQSMAQGTNFAVDLNQLRALRQLVARRFPLSQFGRAVELLERGEALLPRDFKPATLQPPGESQDHMAWLIVADFIGYQKLRRRTGDRPAAAELDLWTRSLRPLFETHGGVVQHAIGDSLLVAWDERMHSPGDIMSTVRALQQHQASSRAPFRFVLHYGRITPGANEKPDREMQFALDTERAAKTFRVPTLLTQAAVDSLGLQRECEKVGDRVMDGITHSFYVLRTDSSHPRPA